MACRMQTTTKSGTFTVHGQRIKKCKAKKICESKGEILAPIETKEDLHAIHELLMQGCGVFENMPLFHTGLDIAVCGKEEKRVFTDGAKWNQTLHGPLYEEVSFVSDSNVRIAAIGETNLEIIYIVPDETCGEMDANFICLKPAKPTGEPEALVKNADLHSFNNLAFLAFAIPTIAFFCAVGIAMKFYRRNQVLEEEKRNMSNNA